jgi:hypothetical protein
MKVIPETDSIAGAIADIEKRRLATENDAGMALARSSALHRLKELLDHETEALRLRGPGSAHRANVEIVRTEIGRVRRLYECHHARGARSARPRTGQVFMRPTRAPVIGINQHVEDQV